MPLLKKMIVTENGEVFWCYLNLSLCELQASKEVGGKDKHKGASFDCERIKDLKNSPEFWS